MSLWSIIKFYLGLKVVAKFGNEYVVTKRELGIMRVCLDRNTDFWWMHGYWNRYCSFTTVEAAEQRMNTVIPKPPKPKPLRLTPIIGQ